MSRAAAPHARPPHWNARQPALTFARDAKMASSAHAYVRGNTRQYYDWLGSIAPRSVPQGPSIWICGDCHIGNLGPVANADGAVDIQIRDFDQTVIGNPVHDLIRLSLSLAMAARGSDLPGVTTTRMVEELILGYREAFRGRRKKPAAERSDAIVSSLRQARGRSWRHLARERLDGSAQAFPLGKQFWHLSRVERSAVQTLVKTPELSHLATQLEHRDIDATVRLLDAAYWKKGCSSLGLLRFAALLDVERGASRGRDLCLIDIKEAVKAVAPRIDGASMPRSNADRVVAGARAMSPYLGERMVATQLLGKSVFVRELLPEDLKLELPRIGIEEATRAARYLAWVVGKAHARQLDAAARKAWLAELGRTTRRSIAAPGWLWSSLLDLVGIHERGYLEHCRRVVAGPAARVPA